MTKLYVFVMVMLFTPPAPAAVTPGVNENTVCSESRCFDRVPIGPAGLDIVAQMTRYETLFNNNFEPKRHGEPITFAQLLTVAGALGLSDQNRGRVLTDFSRLVVIELGANLHPVRAAKQNTDVAGDHAVSIPFVIKIDWADHAGQRGVGVYRGQLNVPRDQDIDLSQAAVDMNRHWSSMIQIEGSAGGGPTANHLTELIAPAVVGNLILGYLSPPDQLKGTALESLGHFFSDAGPTQ